MSLSELRREHDLRLAELRSHLDIQLSNLRARLNAQVRQEFERRVRELEELLQANTVKAQRKFEEDMAKSEKIENPVLREANEQFLRSSLDSYVGFQKRLLENFVASWSK